MTVKQIAGCSRMDHYCGTLDQVKALFWFLRLKPKKLLGSGPSVFPFPALCLAVLSEADGKQREEMRWRWEGDGVVFGAGT